MGSHDHMLNRIEFQYQIEPGTKPGKDPAWHELTAHFSGLPQHNLGSLTWKGTGTHEISNIRVDEDYQRHGIATHMYEYAKKLDPNISHSENRTPQGDRWARTTGDKLPPKWEERVFGNGTIRQPRSS